MADLVRTVNDWGFAKGVRIPNSLLVKYGITSHVIFKEIDGRIVLEPLDLKSERE